MSAERLKQLIRKNFPDASSLDREEAFRLLDELKEAAQRRQEQQPHQKDVKPELYSNEWERLQKVR